MAKIRVHQLAKELGIDSKVIITEAEKHGIQVKNHMSSLKDSDEFMLRAFLEELRPVVKAEPPAAPPPPPAPPAATAPKTADPDEDSSAGQGASDAPAPSPVREAPRARPEPGPGRGRDGGGPPQRRDVVARPAGAPARPPAREVAARPAGGRNSDGGAPTRESRPPAREVAAAPPGVQARPAVPSRPTAPGVTARPAGQQDPRDGEAKSPRGEGGQVTARPRAAAGSATAKPPAPGDSTLVQRTPTTQRRQAQILGRRELPPQRQGGSGPGRTGSGTGGSGLIATRSDGNKRTFVVAGRGRGPGRGGQATRGGATGRGGRGDRERRMTKPRQQDLSAITPDLLTVEMPITVKGLSEKLGVKANLIIRTLFIQHKKMVKINDPLDKDTVELLGLEYACDITCVEKVDIETRVIDQLESSWVSEQANLEHRHPLVSFLGHVDHGKTSLLDAIRKTNVASKEHGGITQHIGASRVDLPDGKGLVLLDTPGHQAFTEMRARGAQVTDIVVLVVAGDDGVMPQTKEAIAHAKAAGVPIVVAMNKMDRPESNANKVRQELANEGLQDESWGGDTVICEVSATTGDGIDNLIEYILLEAEVLELKADSTRPAVATVIEAEQSKGEGNMARLVVNDGTLKKGDIFVCGTAYGRIRAIKTTDRAVISSAGPSMPVEITGLNHLPSAGDKLYILQDLEEAKMVAHQRSQLRREKEIAKASHVNLENLFDKLKSDALKLILKVDVNGSLEVLQREIMKLTHPEVRPEIIHSAVGGITETDVTLADASDAIILGFHVSADMAARRVADQRGVEIRLYQVIYKLIEEIRDAMEGKLAPEQREVITGEVEVRATWKVSRLGVIAGCYVRDGIVKKASRVRVARDGIVIHDAGHIASLKRVKDDVREVKEDFECGILLKDFQNIQIGDVITAYEIQEIKRTFADTAMTPSTN